MDDDLSFLYKKLYYPSNSKNIVLFRLKGAKIGFMDGTKTDTVRSCWKRSFNCLVRTKTQGYTHSELIFVMENQEDMKEYWIACGIRTGEMLKLEFREYSSFLWKSYGLIMNTFQMNQLFEECVDDVASGIAYNNAVYWNFAVPSCFAVDKKGVKAWCSEHNVYKFRNIGWPEFDDIAPYLTDPYTLLCVLIENNRLSTGSLPPSQLDGDFELDLSML